MTTAPVDPTSTEAWARLGTIADAFDPDLLRQLEQCCQHVGRHQPLGQVDDEVGGGEGQRRGALGVLGEPRAQVRPNYDDARAVMKSLADAGIDYDDVIATLEKEGVDKFLTAWNELLATVQTNLDGARNEGGAQ